MSLELPKPSLGGAKAALLRGPSNAVANIAAVLLVLSLAASGFLYLNVRGHDADQKAGEAVIELARTAAPQVLSYDYSALPDYRDRVRELTTGKFRDEITELIDKTIVPAAKKDQIVTQATVPEVSIVSENDSKVVLLMFVNQVTRKKTYKTPQVEGSRVRISFVKTDGKWKISQFDPV